MDGKCIPGIRMAKSGWWYLKDAWEELERIATEREVQKFSLRSGRQLSKWSTHLVGLVGEAVVAAQSGLDLDARLLLAGDDGHDFSVDGNSVNVKTSCYVGDPHLKVMVREKKLCDYYILVEAEMVCRRARVAGHATAAMIKGAKVRSYGHGMVFSIPASGLVEGLPPCMKRKVK